MNTSSKDDGNNSAEEDDQLLWQRIARTVTPLPGKDQVSEIPKTHPKKSKRPAHRPPAPENITPAKNRIKKDTDFPVPGIDRRTEERLRRGQLPIEARIDLHGMTQVQAQSALEHFLPQAQAEGKRCVLVITGKGTRTPDSSGHWMEPEKSGVLKRKVPLWLCNATLGPIVLRTAPAKPRHGGQGALYVLLRRKRD